MEYDMIALVCSLVFHPSSLLYFFENRFFTVEVTYVFAMTVLK